MICLVLTEDTVADCIATAREHERRIDGVELRADFLSEAELPEIGSFPERLRREADERLFSILTIRRVADGGRYSESEERRLELLRGALEQGTFDYVDLEEDRRGLAEWDALAETARARGCTVIRSLHDFAGVPEAFTGRVETLAERDGEIPKAAVTPKSVAELHRVIEAFRVVRESGGIVLGMGSVGFPTRVLVPVLGGTLTFCSAPDRQAAPGHVDPATLDEVYGYHRLGPDTRIFGVIGNPIMHSHSPEYHNAAFRQAGLDAVYLPFHVDDVTEFFALARFLGVRGLSVTIPHKEAAIPLLQRADASVTATGACNTVLFSEDGASGVNTDVEGFLSPLREARFGTVAAGGSVESGDSGRSAGSLAGLRATVIGAGGAARAVAYALLREGAAVCIVNRTREKALRLAEQAAAWMPEDARDGIPTAALDESAAELVAEYGDIIVQTTSVGMSPVTEQDPLWFYRFRGSEMVYDIIYTPERTRLIERADAAGCRTVTGSAMFRAQAAEQARLFRELV
jgi:3-dehydroquinate dehydratase/shikimate dehydrogenase